MTSAVLAAVAGSIAYQPLAKSDERWALAFAAAGTVGAAIFAGFAQEFNHDQARSTQAQVRLLEGQLQGEIDARRVAEEESNRRAAEAAEAREHARRVLTESIKSRLDALAPRISVLNSDRVRLKAQDGTEVVDPAQLGDALSPDVMNGFNIWIELTFEVVNHGDTYVQMFVPDNPFTLTAGESGTTAIGPKESVKFQYVIEGNFETWRSYMADGFGGYSTAQDNPWMLEYVFQFTDQTGNVTDTHTWRSQIMPFQMKPDGGAQLIKPAVQKVPVAWMRRNYGALDIDSVTGP